MVAAVEALLIWLSYSASAGNTHFSVKDGLLDISQWNYEGTLPLSGGWDFYWHEFLHESDLQSTPSPDLKAQLPAVWNDYIADGREIGGIGYATYRLHVIGAKAGKTLALRVAPFSTAYELYIDDRLMASSGQIGKTIDEHVPQYRLRVFEFTPQSSSFDIILHISNFTYARGGPWYAPYMGAPETIRHLDNNISSCQFFLFGSYFIMLMFCGYLYFLRRDKSLLLYMALCILFVGRTVIYGAYFINTWFPSLLFQVTVWIDYITLYLFPCFLLILLRLFYPGEVSAKVVKLTVAYSAAATLITLASPVYYISQFKYFAEFLMVLTNIYIIYALINAVKKGRPHTNFMLAGMLTLMVGVFFDLYQNTIISYGYIEISPIGFLIMMSLWGCALAQRYVRALHEREQVLLELNASNEKKRQAELKFLKSQIRPHFINNALNTIISISRTDTSRARTLLVQFSKYLRGCYDFESLNDTIPIEQELECVRAYLMIEQARFGDELHIEYDIEDVSVLVPPLILQPLVENAVIHGVRGKPGGGHILVYIKSAGSYIKLGVKDDGVGIGMDNIKDILDGRAENHGIALFNINQRLYRLYGTGLDITRLETGGLDVSILIPREKDDRSESGYY